MATAKQKALMGNILSQANKINAEHDVYVAQFVTRANEELYALLANMMRVCEEIWVSDCEEYLHKQIRKEMKDKWGIKTQKNTSTTSLVIRYVTRGNRQLVHNYAKVINAAREDGVNSDNLVQYIKLKGSIDAVRKKVVDIEQKKLEENKTNAQNGRVAALLSRSKNIGKIELNNGQKAYKAGCSDIEFSVTLSTWVDGEERAVASIYPSYAIIKFCLELYRLTCEIAALDDGTNKFYAACKEHGLNMDIIHRWMKDNCIEGQADALEMARYFNNDDYEYNTNTGLVKIAA